MTQQETAEKLKYNNFHTFRWAQGIPLNHHSLYINYFESLFRFLRDVFLYRKARNKSYSIYSVVEEAGLYV